VTSDTARRLAPFTVAIVDVNRVGASERLPHACDLLLVGLSGTSLAALEWSLAHWASLSWPEMVFVSSDQATDPTATGLGAAGARYVLAENTAAAWLLEHAPALADFARARRALIEASRRLPSPPSAPMGDPAQAPVGLFQAEQQFRMTYVRMLLASSASRREAAVKARIAYRTFCHILEKLGISVRKIRRQKLAGLDDPSVALKLEDFPGNYGSRAPNQGGRA
jgi:hypothetical protein